MGRRSNGGAIVRALDALSAISGNIGIAGGGVSLFQAPPAFDLRSRRWHPRREPFANPASDQSFWRWTILASARSGSRAAIPSRCCWNRKRPRARCPSASSSSSRIVPPWYMPARYRRSADDDPARSGRSFRLVRASLSRRRATVASRPSCGCSDLQIIQGLASRMGLADRLAGTAREWKERFVSTRLAERGVDLQMLERGAVKTGRAPGALRRPQVQDSERQKRISFRLWLPALRPRPPEYPLRLMSLSTPRAQSSQWAIEPASYCAHRTSRCCDGYRRWRALPDRVPARRVDRAVAS